MNAPFVYELIGYTGSILVAVSLMMRSVFRLRVINLIGAIFFTAYGILIAAWPVAFLNGLIVLVNVYYLRQMWNHQDYFKLMEVNYDSRYLKNFLEFYKKEISEFVPTYRFQPSPGHLVVFVLRNMLPVGVLIVRAEGKQAEIFLDFVIPGYRDFRAGKFLFERSFDYFREKGIKRLVSEPGNAVHEAYLKRMGFQLEDGMYYRLVSTEVLKDRNL
ncbi:MAG: GNAT family N-acetyltransferase [Anaerolineales bacterium]|nr:GNAT family N-acetyltransferase [Anaerolineales bacterium]